jgi:hypothetical protein
METAQTLDEAGLSSPNTTLTGVAAFSRFKGVQFAVEVSASDETEIDNWACEDPAAMAGWINATTVALKKLGDTLEAGDLTDIEGLGPQRHVAVLVGDDENLGVGFTRSALLPHIRETMKQIEAKWAH